MFTQLRRTILFVPLAALTLISAGLAQDQPRRGRKYVPPPETAKIEVTVLRASSGKPIRNAAVVFHPIQGEKDKGAMELKTNDEGKAIIDVIPIGDTVRLQIIAPGFRTYGEDYKIESPERTITVKMVKPTEQYSIYGKNAEDPPPTASSPAPPTTTASPSNSSPPQKN